MQKLRGCLSQEMSLYEAGIYYPGRNKDYGYSPYSGTGKTSRQGGVGLGEGNGKRKGAVMQNGSYFFLVDKKVLMQR